MANRQFKKNLTGIYDGNISQYVYQAVPPHTICLDVGCWTGNLGAKLIKDKQCTVDGVDLELAPLDTAKSRGYRKIYSLDLNYLSAQIDIFKEKYDVIICADVLEHLMNPKEVLIALRKILNKNGKIIISVPNVAFILYRVLLLLGKFDYNPKGGIMDATHLRWFTKKTIEELCISAGFTIEYSQGYNQVKNHYFFLRPLAKIFPGLFALQFLLIINPQK